MAVKLPTITQDASIKIEKINNKASGIFNEIDRLETDSKANPQNIAANNEKINELSREIEKLGDNIDQINSVLNATYDSIDKMLSDSITITKLP